MTSQESSRAAQMSRPAAHDADTAQVGARSRWAVIVAYCAVAAASQALLVNYAPVTNDAARHFGVSVTAVGWLSQVFPLVYVLVAIPAGLVLDRFFRPALVIGALLTAGGALLRLTGDSYAWAMAGQVVAAAGQPFVLNAVTGLVVVYLVAKDRTAGIAVASSAIFAGMVAGSLIGAGLPGEEHIRTLTVITAVLAAVAALGLISALGVVRPLAGADAIPATNGLQAVRAAFGNRYLRRLCAIVAIPMGTFTALVTYGQPLLKPAGVSETSAGLILASMMVAGVVASAFVPVWADRHAREVQVMGLGVALTAGACLVLAVAPSTMMAYITLIGVGLVLLPALPIVLALTERHAQDAEGTAAGLIWLSGNIGAVLITTVVGSLVAHESVDFVILAVLTIVAMPAISWYRSLDRSRRAGDAV